MTLVSRQGLGSGLGGLGRDRGFSLLRQSHFGYVLRQRFCVATGPGDGVVETRDNRAPWTRNRVRDRVHDAHDSAHNVRVAVRATDLTRCTMLCTV